MENREITVSIVMPAYNAEKTIGQAIESVLCQTHKKFELIIIDDQSGDRTVPIAEEYACSDSRIRILKNSVNSGVSVSRNNGVRASKMEWIAFLDSDDAWEADKLEIQLKTMMEYPKCSICFTGSAFMDETSHRFGYTLEVPSRITYKELLKQNLISCSSTLVKKERLLQYPMHNDSMIHEDYATWLKILKEDSFAVGVNQPLLIYRISKSSKSGDKLKAAKMQWRTYRHVKVPFIKAVCSFVTYSHRNVQKYLHIRNS